MVVGVEVARIVNRPNVMFVVVAILSGFGVVCGGNDSGVTGIAPSGPLLVELSQVLWKG